MQDDADGLFPDPRPAQPPIAEPDPDAAPSWLVAKLRKALDDLGLKSMDDREALVVELAGRRVGSLRELTFFEARQIEDDLRARLPNTKVTDTRSAWDDRESDTWIDRL